jgi:hypothetical protein
MKGCISIHCRSPEHCTIVSMRRCRLVRPSTQSNGHGYVQYFYITMLAPYLFVIVVDYVMRVALADQSLGLKITNKVGTTTRIKTPAKYITDLDFADDIMLISYDAIDSVDIMARKVGLKINRAKTE